MTNPMIASRAAGGALATISSPVTSGTWLPIPRVGGSMSTCEPSAMPAKIRTNASFCRSTPIPRSPSLAMVATIPRIPGPRTGVSDKRRPNPILFAKPAAYVPRSPDGGIIKYGLGWSNPVGPVVPAALPLSCPCPSSPFAPRKCVHPYPRPLSPPAPGSSAKSYQQPPRRASLRPTAHRARAAGLGATHIMKPRRTPHETSTRETPAAHTLALWGIPLEERSGSDVATSAAPNQMRFSATASSTKVPHATFQAENSVCTAKPAPQAWTNKPALVVRPNPDSSEPLAMSPHPLTASMITSYILNILSYNSKNTCTFDPNGHRPCSG